MKILLIAYDNGSMIPWIPQGLAALATVLLTEGHHVQIYNQDTNHWPEEHLTEFLNTYEFDIVGLSMIAGYYEYQKMKKISAAVKKSTFSGKYILGGHMPSSDPEYFLKLTGADCVVIGEGEIAIMEFIKNPEQRIIKCEQIKDINEIGMPAYHLLPMDIYKRIRMPNCDRTDFCLPMLSGRGCTFKCNFCYRMMKGFRARSPQSICEEMRYLYLRHGVNYFSFSDELLMNSVKRTESICDAFLALPFEFKWDCNGRLNYAKPEVLQKMKDSGCVFINYGIEAYDDQVLKNMHKHLTCEQIRVGIENTLDKNISPGFNIIWGNIGDNRETLHKGVEFLLKYDDHSQMRTIRFCTPYPGCELFDEAIKRGLCKDVEDFYENLHKNSDLMTCNFMDMTDNEAYEALFKANSVLLENYHKHKGESYVEQARTLYLERDDSYRGFRQN